jgi:retron-type reverse transcriptase
VAIDGMVGKSGNSKTIAKLFDLWFISCSVATGTTLSSAIKNAEKILLKDICILLWEKINTIRAEAFEKARHHKQLTILNMIKKTCRWSTLKKKKKKQSFFVTTLQPISSYKKMSW